MLFGSALTASSSSVKPLSSRLPTHGRRYKLQRQDVDAEEQVKCVLLHGYVSSYPGRDRLCENKCVGVTLIEKKCVSIVAKCGWCQWCGTVEVWLAKITRAANAYALNSCLLAWLENRRE